MSLVLFNLLQSIEQIDPDFKADVSELFETFSDMVYRIAVVRTPQQSDADDVFQEVFMRLVKHHRKLRSLEHAKAWLIRCTINCCNSYHTSAWQKKTVGLEEYSGQTNLEYQHIELLDAVRSLTPQHQEVIHLFYYVGYSNKEIADILNISENTVKSRLRRARHELRSVWSEEDDPIETE
jgi:RNA polymerase sigma-70 factor (ECF subfamily)